VTISTSSDGPAGLSFIARFLTPRRIRAQAIVLALCLWGVCAVDFATSGVFDRAGNVKFQDFLQFYISARLIREGRTGQLYDQHVADQELRALVGETRVRLPTVYGPQVGWMFLPLARLPFAAAARIWIVLSLVAFGTCLYLIVRCCPNLRLRGRTVVIYALAFPPLFHFFVRGQISVLVLACFTAAFLAFRADHDWLAGIALGFLAFKPQFLVAIPVILLLSHAWRALAGLIASALGQLVLTTLHFGSAVMRSYLDTMFHMSRWIGNAELSLAPIQMHSLRAFWTLLIPWTNIALALYVLSSSAVIAMAVAIWKSSEPISLRFSALTLAAVLVNPHIFVYDLLVLAPVLLILADWALSYSPSFNGLWLLLYLAFITPLFGPLSQWTRLQLSVPVFAGLLWILWRTAGHTLTLPALASDESHVV